MTDTLNWYAFRIFRNGRKSFIKRLSIDAVYCFSPEKTVVKVDPVKGEKVEKRPLFTSLIFVHATPHYVFDIQYDQLTLAFPYLSPGTTKPAVIPDDQMENFMETLKLGGDSAEVYEGELHEKDRVRVTSGAFAGREGYIVRVKGSKKFVVSIDGVVAVSTIYIPQSMLEKINKEQ